MRQPTGTRSLIRGTAGAILLSAFAVFVLVRLTSGSNGWRSVFAVDPMLLITAGGFVVLGWALDALRMQTLVRALGTHLGFWSALRITLAGAFAACITPFDTGGEPLQVYLLHQQGFGAGESTAIIAIKSFVSALARLFMVLLFPAWYVLGRRSWEFSGAVEAALFIGLVVYVSVFGLLLFFAAYPESIGAILGRILSNRFMSRVISAHTASSILEKVEKGVGDFRTAFKTFLHEQRPVLYLIGVLSLLGWAIAFFIPVLLLRGLGVDPPFAQTMAIAGIFYLAAAYAPTPGSSGAAELSLALLFGSIVPFPLLGIFVLLWRTLTYYLTLVVGGAAIAISYGQQRSRKGGSREK